MSQQIFAQSVDLLKKVLPETRDESSRSLVETLSPENCKAFFAELAELYSQIKLFLPRLSHEDRHLVDNEFHSQWSALLRVTWLALNFEQGNLSNQPPFGSIQKSTLETSNADSADAKNAVFFRLSQFYHTHEESLFNPGSAGQVSDLLHQLSKDLGSQAERISALTSEEVLDRVVLSDSFLVLLAGVLSALEDGFDFDHQKIKYNFTQQFEKLNAASGIASRSKSKFVDFGLDNFVKDDEDFVGRRLRERINARTT